MESKSIDSENEGLTAPTAVPVNVYGNLAPELRTHYQDGLITMHDCSFEFLWERFTSCGVVVLDDYAGVSCHEQKLPMDDFARRVHGHILSLPTGQGRLIKSCPVNATEHR